jgi:hypothetical protein
VRWIDTHPRSATIALRTFVTVGAESESAVAVQGDIEISDRDDR